MHTYDWTVRHRDCDPFGIAHYPRIVLAVHKTAAQFMDDIGHPFWHLATERGGGFPMLEIDLEFHQMIEAGETVTIGMQTDIGDSSLRFVYEAINDDDVVFSGFEQRVFVDEDGNPASIPDDIREGLETIAIDE